MSIEKLPHSHNIPYDIESNSKCSILTNNSNVSLEPLELGDSMLNLKLQVDVLIMVWAQFHNDPRIHMHMRERERERDHLNHICKLICEHEACLFSKVRGDQTYVDSNVGFGYANL